MLLLLLLLELVVVVVKVDAELLPSSEFDILRRKGIRTRDGKRRSRSLPPLSKKVTKVLREKKLTIFEKK